MSTSSIVIESKDIPERKHAQDHSVIVPQSVPVKDRKYDAIKHRIHRHIIEAIKSSITVFAYLALYKITGVHSWWVQFVHGILFTP